MKNAQFQGFEDEYPYEDNINNNDNGLVQPVIPGTNLPIQTEAAGTEDVTAAREPEPEPEPENIAWSTTFIEETGVVESTVPIAPLMTGLQEDPDSHPDKTPPSNYQTKVPDPTGEGGKEAEVEQLLERLDEFRVRDQSSPTVDQDPRKAAEARDPTGEGGKETEVEPLLERLDEFHIRDQSSPTVDRATKKSVADYPRKAAEALAPVYGKVAALSKLGSDKGVSAREYLVEKLRPGEDDKALSDAIFGRFRKKEDVLVGERNLGVMDRLKGAFKSSTGLGTIPGLGAEHMDKEARAQPTATTVMRDVSSG